MRNSCFTMLYWFSPYTNMDQPSVYICPFLFEPPPPTSLPTQPARLSEGPVCAPWVKQQIPTGSLFCICFHAILSIHPILSYLPPPYSQSCSLCLHLHCWHADVFISTIFLDSIYMHEEPWLKKTHVSQCSWFNFDGNDFKYRAMRNMCSLDGYSLYLLCKMTAAN